MTTKLVPIGNSKGLRLPKALLQAVGIEDAVELRVDDGSLVITPVRRRRLSRRRRKPREGWEQAIRAEIARGGPPEVDSDWEQLPNAWDAKGWQW